MKKNKHSKYGSVIVENADSSVINCVSWKRAMRLILKGSAQIVEASDQTISNFEGTYVFVIPKIIRLVKYIHGVFRAKVSYTKTNIMIRDKFRCGYCESKENLTIDHVVPISKGGKSTWENSVTACKPCNSSKGNKLLENSGLTLRIPKPRCPNHVEFIRNKIELFGSENISKS